MWLRELVGAFRDEEVGAVGGLVDSYYDEKGIDRYEKVKSSLRVGSWFKRSEKAERFFYVPTCNLLVRRKIFLEVAGFREHLHVGEDVDFCWRMQAKGYDLDFRPAGRIYHKHRSLLKAFAARRHDYGTSEPILQKLHPEKKKELMIPFTSLLCFSTAILALFLNSLAVSALIPAIVFFESVKKYPGVKKCVPSINFLMLLLSSLRGHIAFLVMLSSFTSRYYLITIPLIIAFSPLAAFLIVIMHIISGSVEYMIKKPKLNVFVFLFFFSIEQLSYQSGVWLFCLKERFLNPVNPKLTIRF